MEPRFFKRGNATAIAEQTAARELQWSHVFSNVEIQMQQACSTAITELQWSHVFSNVEIFGTDAGFD